jgi:hypothetical protein
MSGASSSARCARRTRTGSSARASKCVLLRPPNAHSHLRASANFLASTEFNHTAVEILGAVARAPLHGHVDDCAPWAHEGLAGFAAAWPRTSCACSPQRPSRSSCTRTFPGYSSPLRPAFQFPMLPIIKQVDIQQLAYSTSCGCLKPLGYAHVFVYLASPLIFALRSTRLNTREFSYLALGLVLLHHWRPLVSRQLRDPTRTGTSDSSALSLPTAVPHWCGILVKFFQSFFVRLQRQSTSFVLC